DVSSIKVLINEWYGGKYASPPKLELHRALSDIEEPIAELDYYRRNVFVSWQLLVVLGLLHFVGQRLIARRLHGRLVVAEGELAREAEMNAAAEEVADLRGGLAQRFDGFLRVVFLQSGDVDLRVVQVRADFDVADRAPAELDVLQIVAEDVDERVADVLADF